MTQSSLIGRMARSENLRGWAMVSPTALVAILLLAAPLGMIVAFSFMTDGYLEILPEFTFENYAKAWSDPLFRQILFRSLYVSALVTVATVVLAFPIAYFVSFHVAPERKSLWLFLITIPFWTSYLIRVFLWKVILGYSGVINSGLMGLGLISEPLTFFNYSVSAIIATLAHAYAPFAILPIFVALERIDRSLLEASRDLGEGHLRTFWRVTLPLSIAGVVSAVLIVFIPTVGDYVTPQLIGGGKIPLVANLIQNRMLDLDNKPAGSALAVSSMVIVAIISVAFLWANRRYLRVGR